MKNLMWKFLILSCLFSSCQCQFGTTKDETHNEVILLSLNDLKGRFVGINGESEIELVISKIENNQVIGKSRTSVNKESYVKTFKGTYDSLRNFLILYEDSESNNSGKFEGSVSSYASTVNLKWKSHQGNNEINWELKKVGSDIELSTKEDESGNKKEATNNLKIKNILVSARSWKNNKNNKFIFSEKPNQSYYIETYKGMLTEINVRGGIHGGSYNSSDLFCECKSRIDWSLSGNDLKIKYTHSNCECKLSSNSESHKDEVKNSSIRNKEIKQKITVSNRNKIKIGKVSYFNNEN